MTDCGVWSDEAGELAIPYGHFTNYTVSWVYKCPPLFLLLLFSTTTAGLLSKKKKEIKFPITFPSRYTCTIEQGYFIPQYTWTNFFPQKYTV